MKKTSVLFLTVILNLCLFAQHQNILISNEDYPEEPSIYIDPKNTDHIVAGSNIDNVFTSLDGGYTWDIDELVSVEYNVAGDPCVIIDTAGDFYYFHLSSPSSGSWLDRIVCQKSTDHGQTWNDGTYMGLNPPKDQDKEWAVVDRTNNNIYVTWTQFDLYKSPDPLDSSNIMFSRSINGGLGWSEAKRINKVAGDCADDDNTVEGAVPTIGPNGEIYVSWSGPLGIVFDKSYDHGETWLDHDIFVSDHPGGWNITIPGIKRCNGMPVTCCDISGGTHQGNIYINWADQRNGTDDTDIWLVKSTDGGETWSESKRINNDPPGKQQFFTWMTIDQTNGFVYFVFYDRRNYDDDLTDVYMAVSRDGGETFINFKVSESPFLPNASVFFGDYTNISAHNDIIRPIWTRLDWSDLSVWTAIVNPGAVGFDIEEEISLSLEQNYPNPFTKTTYFAFKLYHPSNITLKVYDTFGRLCATLLENEYRFAGKYVEQFDASPYHFSPGVYYFSLITDDKTTKKKMLFLR